MTFVNIIMKLFYNVNNMNQKFLYNCIILQDMMHA